jgi:ribosomal protein S19E (S16A)
MSIPTPGQLKALRVIKRMEQGETVFVIKQNAEECENQGWAEAQPGGGYRLTPEGRQILEADVNEIEGD